jgi:hypothetical protein
MGRSDGMTSIFVIRWVGSLDELVDWYNIEKPHGALNLNRAETPSEAFIRKMRPEVWLGLAAEIFGW